jgi:hypothetical protein
MLTKELTFTERNQNNSELSVTCEAAGCYSKATDKIVVKVGNLGVISLLLCRDCVAKFQEVQQT